MQAPPPNKRPKCLSCGKRLKPTMTKVGRPEGIGKPEIVWFGDYKFGPRFCRQKCGWAWAQKAADRWVVRMLT